MTRVLIAGIHLAQYLLANGEQVHGLDQSPAGLPPTLAESVPLYSGDIRSQAVLRRALAETQPDIIYHLAGLLKSPDAKEFYEINVLGTLALFEAIVELGLTPKVLITSSSAVYGRGLGYRPITENFKLRPATHYAVSKVVQETIAYRYHLVYNVPVICTRAFNLIGPGQSPVLACSAFARQIALAEHRRQIDTLVTGNLSPRRDFVDVRDAVRAYSLVVQSGKPGLAYNVCSQHAISIKQCLDLLLEMTNIPLKTIVAPANLQVGDVPVQVGCAARLVEYTGWRPEITLEQSLADLLNYWRQQIKSQA